MRVLLIVAPFGLVEYPNLAASLLKAEAVAAGFDCDLHYASVDFARRIGFGTYATICTIDAQLLIPERLFAPSLFGERIPPWNEYWRDVVAPYEQPLHDHLRVPDEHRARAGFLARFQDEAEAFVDEFAARPELGSYDLFGFSTSYGQNCASLSLAQRLKRRHPEKPILFGGANCAGGMGAKILELFPFVDYVCADDGDLSFPRLLGALAAGSDAPIAGIQRRGAASPAPDRPPEMVTDLDALPYPDFSDYFAAFRFSGEEPAATVAMPMETSRGCWWGMKHHCVFCGLNRDSMAYRQKSGDRIEAEIRHLVRTYGRKKIMMTDNIMSRSFVRDVAPRLARDPEHGQIFFEVKSNLSKDDLRRLKAARIDHLQPGIESLSTRVLSLMDKGVDSFQNLQLLKWAKELGIRLSWNILCGFPGETAEDYDAQAALFPLVHHLQPALGFSQITIDRFSPLFADPERFGIRLEPVRGYRYVYPFAADDLRQLAYWFAQRGRHLDGSTTLAAPAYARGAYQAYLIWRRVYPRAELRYDYDAAGRILVFDSRGVAVEGERRLDPLETRVFAALDHRRSRAGLLECLEADGGVAVRGGEVDAVLERLRRWRYLYEEGGLMLVLACRAAASAADRSAISAAAAAATEGGRGRSSAETGLLR